jgi:hypothetical protein
MSLGYGFAWYFLSTMGESLAVNPVVLTMGFGVAFISSVIVGIHPSIQKLMRGLSAVASVANSMSKNSKRAFQNCMQFLQTRGIIAFSECLRSSFTRKKYKSMRVFCIAKSK